MDHKIVGSCESAVICVTRLPDAFEKDPDGGGVTFTTTSAVDPHIPFLPKWVMSPGLHHRRDAFCIDRGLDVRLSGSPAGFIQLQQFARRTVQHLAVAQWHLLMSWERSRMGRSSEESHCAFRDSAGCVVA